MKESVITCHMRAAGSRDDANRLLSRRPRLTDSAPANRNPAWPVAHKERDTAKYTPSELGEVKSLLQKR